MERIEMKKLLCAFLAAVMIMGMIPMSVVAMAAEEVTSYLSSNRRVSYYSNDYWSDDYWTDDYWTDDYWTDDPYWTDDLGVWTDVCWTDGDSGSYWTDGDVYARIKYVINDGEVKITDYVGNAQYVIIPSFIEGCPVTFIGDSAFYYSSFRKITLPDGLRTIASCGFEYCYDLREIELPSSVTSIGIYAFCNCYSLESITIPDSVTYIDSGTFSNCSSLKSITLPEGLTSICCGVFSNCTSLETITIPSSVTGILEGAFSNCTSLESITIPAGVTSIGSDVFPGCTSLTSMVVEEDNSVYHSSGNCIIETETKTLVAGCANSVIPADGSVTSIGSCAFANYSNLVSITIPDDVISIESAAFRSCVSLEAITIPESVTYIHELALHGCSALASIVVEEGNSVYHSDGNCLIKTATKTLVIGCKNSIIPDDGSVTNIGDYAFYCCESLTSITIPEGVTSIGYSAFSGCYNLESIALSERLTSIGHSAFSGCTALASITIPAGVTSIGGSAFSSCQILKNITIPEGVTSIGDYAFAYCYDLTSVTIPDSVTYIDSGTFYNCYSLASITLPESLTSISDYAFYYCESLTSITIPDSITRIGYGAFGECYNLNTVYFTGSEEQWYSIYIEDYNQCLTNANIICCKHSNTTYYEGKDPVSCSEPGYTEGVYCNDCGRWISGHTEIVIPHTDENGDGVCDSCGRSMSDILPGETKTVEVSAYEITYLKFIPTVSGVYTFTSSCFYSDGDTYCDTYGYLYDADFDQITSNDDGGNGNNFKITHELYKGETYYWGARFYDRYRSGSFDVTLVCDEVFCDHINTTYHEATNGTCSEAGYTAGTYCNDCRTWIEGHESVVAPHTDENSDGVCDSCGASTLPEGLIYSISGGEVTITDYTGSATEVIIPATIEGCPVTSIGNEAFYWCTSLTSITIPESVTSIGNHAFRDCSSLTSITIPDSVTSIGDYAFSDCTSLTSITIPEGVTSIGNEAFYYCESLTSITLPEGVTSIGDFAFSWCTSLTNITIPEGVTSIGDGAFSHCRSLTSIILPEGVTRIGEYAFNKCTSLTSITIPEGVTRIGTDAFYDCESLETVNYGGSPSQWAAVSIGNYNEDLTDANIIFAKEDEGETPDTPDEPEIIKGDISGDGKINAMDANAAKRLLNGSANLTEAQRAACDVNGDGQVNAIDINIIGRYLLGFISSLG